MSNGLTNQQSPTPNDAAVDKWQKRLIYLKRLVAIQHKAGMVDTVWDAQIAELEGLIEGAKSPIDNDNDAGETLEEMTDGT